MFEDEDGRWTETARLEPGDATPAHAFGRAIAAAHETIVIGAPYHAAAGERAGTVYVFERRDGRWTKTAKLTPSDPAPGRGFGATVAVSNGTIVVGVRGAANGRNPGAVYVFERRSGKWSKRQGWRRRCAELFCLLAFCLLPFPDDILPSTVWPSPPAPASASTKSAR